MYRIEGFPKGISDIEYSLFESRIAHAVDDLSSHVKKNIGNVCVSFDKSTPLKDAKLTEDKEQSSQDKENVFSLNARVPFYTFEQLILPSDIFEKIIHKIKLFELKDLVFEQWGLKQIEPYPRTALNFYGPSGTGKTMAAHAIASFLKKKIILASYAEIESKYHGDGPKNVKAVFRQAEEQNAILFIDEADSLLSKRLSNVTQGSEQAINSMRSQLLICLEQFSGMVIFSTNFVENYDKAFETRVSNIEFRLPDAEQREKIWKIHLPDPFPLQNDVDVHILATEIDDVCGRDIKNAVIDAALKAACNNTIVSMADLREALNLIKKSRIHQKEKPKAVPLSEEEKNKIKKKLEIAFETEEEEIKK